MESVRPVETVHDVAPRNARTIVQLRTSEDDGAVPNQRRLVAKPLGRHALQDDHHRSRSHGRRCDVGVSVIRRLAHATRAANNSLYKSQTKLMQTGIIAFTMPDSLHRKRMC